MTRNIFSHCCALTLWLLCCVFISVFANGRTAHAQAFPNDGRFYQVRQNGTNSQLYVLNRNVSPYAATAIGTTSPANVILNALAFNEDDRFIYSMELTSNRLYRLSQAGPSAIGTVTGLPSASYNSGAIDNNGIKRNYYVATLTTSTIYRINNVDLATTGAGSAASGITLDTIPLSQQINTGDFAVNPLDGKLYAVSAQSNPPVISVIDITSAATTKPVTLITTSGISSANATIGSVFFDTAGKLYAYSNNGVFFTINLTTGVATQLSTAPTTSQSDGASNAYFTIPFTLTKTVTNIARPNATTYDVTFSVSLRNDSVSSPASNVQLTENLDRAFGTGSPTLSILTAPANAGGTNLPVNAAFNGRQAGDTRLLVGNSTLGAGQTTTVTFAVRAVYPNAAAIPTQESNTIYASSTGTVNAQGVNAGWTFPSNVPVPPPDLIGSEVSPPAPINFRSISGRVFEDVNYGGGAGRPFGTGGTAGAPAGTRVELYTVSGTTATAKEVTTTAADGSYVFNNQTPGEYLVRVVNSSVTSTRPTTGVAAVPIAVQTFRTTGNVPDGSQVGGNAPAQADAGNSGIGTTINTTNGAISGGGVTGTVAQSIGRVTLGNTDAANVDFGFNFDTIVNTNNLGQGSLRQFIVNSNHLANTGLNQALATPTPGVENTIFMIPAAQLTGGVARITISGLDLPIITDAFTSINGATQTTNIGNTNTAILGAGGNVGASGIALAQVAGPEVEIVNGNERAIGLGVNANDVTIRNLAIYGFGYLINSDGNANILMGDVLRTLVENSVVGASANSFTDPGATARSGSDNIRSVGGDNGTIRNNLIGFGASKGISLGAGSASWTVTGNEVRGNGILDAAQGGIGIVNAGSGNALVSGNLSINNGGVGIDSLQGAGGNTILNNTVTGNGRGSLGTAATAGVRLYSSNNIVDRNLIFDNGGAGILVTDTSVNNRITQNSIYANGSRTNPEQIGIDLLETGQNVNTGTSVAGRGYVTPNDTGDADVGGNGLLNFPVFESAILDTANGTVVLKGWARPGATVEIFVAAPDPSGFGEGQTYLQTRTEGAGDDADATTSTYLGSALNPSQPNVGTDNTNRFEFRIPLLSVGSVLTATATIAQNTSEFSNNVTVSNAAALTRLSGTVYLDANANASRDSGEQGTNETGLFIKAVPLDSSGNPTGPALAAAAVDPATGNYLFTSLNAGRYRLVLDDNNTFSDVTPLNVGARGYIGTEAATGTRDATITAAPNQTPENGAQNFGLFRGARVAGNVFTDNGFNGGTSANGAREGGEIGIAGVTVNAQNAGNAIVATTQTDADGNYVLFVPAGPIRIAEINAPSYISTGATLGNSGGTYTRGTDSTVFTVTAGTAYANLNFGDIQSPTFINDNVQVLAPGGSTFFPHVFTAYAPGTVGFVTNGTSAPAGLNFTRVILRDTNGNGVLDGTENTGGALSSVTITQADINAGGGSVQVALLIQEFAPANAAPGAQDTVGVRATYDPTENGVAPLANVILTRQDIAKAQQSGDLQLLKTVDLATARPGDNVIYTIRFRNTGNNPLTQLVVADKVPAFTTYQSQTVGALPPGLTAPTFTAPAAPQSGVFNWTFGGVLNPGAEGTVTFTVRVNN